jgi:hypothetical protein
MSRLTVELTCLACHSISRALLQIDHGGAFVLMSAFIMLQVSSILSATVLRNLMLNASIRHHHLLVCLRRSVLSSREPSCSVPSSSVQITSKQPSSQPSSISPQLPPSISSCILCQPSPIPSPQHSFRRTNLCSEQLGPYIEYSKFFFTIVSPELCSVNQCSMHFISFNCSDYYSSSMPTRLSSSLPSSVSLSSFSFVCRHPNQSRH